MSATESREQDIRLREAEARALELDIRRRELEAAESARAIAKTAGDDEELLELLGDVFGDLSGAESESEMLDNLFAGFTDVERRIILKSLAGLVSDVDSADVWARVTRAGRPDSLSEDEVEVLKMAVDATRDEHEREAQRELRSAWGWAKKLVGRAA